MLDQYAALEYHLLYNHYPPVSTEFIPACQKAITYCSVGDGDKVIELPNGRKQTADNICEGLHLWPFVDEAIYERTGENGDEKESG